MEIRLLNSMFFLGYSATNTFRKFYKGIETDITDYGHCCQINAYLNFIDPNTVNIDSEHYTANDYLSVPKGSTNGIRGGLKLTLDAETFDYAYWARGESGFRVSLADPRNKPIVNQQSFYIPPGNLNNHEINISKKQIN